MKMKAACGPKRDPEFFAALDEVFAKYPEEAGRYAMSCLKLERDVLRIDLERQVGVARVEDGRIITEFHDRDSDLVRSHHSACCKWVGEGRERKCVWICPE